MSKRWAFAEMFVKMRWRGAAFDSLHLDIYGFSDPQVITLISFPCVGIPLVHRNC